MKSAFCDTQRMEEYLRRLVVLEIKNEDRVDQEEQVNRLA